MGMLLGLWFCASLIVGGGVDIVVFNWFESCDIMYVRGDVRVVDFSYWC